MIIKTGSQILIIFFFFLNPILILSQSSYEPIYNTDIYDFIDNQSSKGNITIFDDVRPYTRITITHKLTELNNKRSSLTYTELEQLDFFLSEYAFEEMFLAKDSTEISEFFKFGSTDRFKVFKYYSSQFTFDIDPVFGIGYDFSRGNYSQFGGIKFKGRISDFVGFYFDYRDFTETGDDLDFHKTFSPLTGIQILKRSANSINYSETRGGLTFGWAWGNFSIAKDFINIGSSYLSSVIMSSKAPSFPFMRLDIDPVEWFQYNFIHAWLDSKMIDSTTIRNTGVDSDLLKRNYSYSRRFKYYVGHTFSFRPFQNWWLTFGESIIYGDRLEFIYFIPLFYRLADHYNSIGKTDSGDNAQIFLNTSYRWTTVKSKFYFSLYIDEFSTSKLLEGEGDNAQVLAWTVGGKVTNPLWCDSYFTLEYNALKPYNYMNADPLHYYTSSDYQLGHWIGTNAVQYLVFVEQFITRLFKVEALFQYIQQGSKENIDDYYDRVESTYPLLSGDVSDYSEFGIKIIYNPIHDLFLYLDFNYILQSDGRFVDEYDKHSGNYIATSFRYGF